MEEVANFQNVRQTRKYQNELMVQIPAHQLKQALQMGPFYDNARAGVNSDLKDYAPSLKKSPQNDTRGLYFKAKGESGQLQLELLDLQVSGMGYLPRLKEDQSFLEEDPSAHEPSTVTALPKKRILF